MRLPAYLLLLNLLAGSALAGQIVRVGAYQNPPKVFTTPDGRTTGIFPEVLDEIAGRRGWEIEYIYGTWEECLARLRSGEIDVMVDVAVSEERRAYLAFSEETIVINWGTVFTRPDVAIQSFLDMEDRTVAVMRGSIHTEGPRGIKALTDRFGVPCRFIEVDSYNDVLMLLESKQADVGIVNRLFGTLYGDEYDVSPTPIIFNPRELVFATEKSSQRGRNLLEQIDKDLSEAKQDPNSVYHQVLAYYLGGATRQWKGQRQKYLRQLHLSPEHERWITEHPRIRFSVDPGFAPFEFITDEGAYRGMAADFLNLVTRKTGLQFELVMHENWSDSVQAARNHEIDLLPCVGHSQERQDFLSYSRPYLKFARVVVTRIDSPVQDLGDLAELQVAVQRDSSHHAFLTENTQIEPRLCGTFEECLLAVSRGEIHATVGNLAVTTHLMGELALTNIKLAAYADSEPQSLAFGVRADWPELTAIIDRALESVTARQRNTILAKWLPLPRAAPTGIDLSQEEREWLLMHPRIRVGWDSSWAPIEFAGPDGAPQGISIEHLKAVEKVLGIQFDTGKATDWQTTYEKLKRREVDMSSCLAITPERLENLDFTDTYLNAPVVLFARDDTPYIRDIAEIGDLRAAIVEGYATDEWVSRDFPNLSLTRVASMAEAFQLLDRNKIDVFVGSVLPGNYYLSRHRHRNIKIVGETPYTYKLRMAVRNDWPLFVGILKKALTALPETDRTAFYRKWVWLRYEHGFDYALFWKIALGALAVFLVLAYWNRRLRMEVQQRTQAQAALAESENALRASYAELKNLEKLKEDLTHMIVHDLRSPLTTITGALDLLKEDLTDADMTELHMAQIGVQKATSMAQAILDIGRLETGKVPLRRVQIDIKAAAATAIDAMELQARLDGVHLVLSGDAVCGRANPDLIHRVLVNLIGNALKASPKGATVEIHTIDSDSQMTVEVHDSGYGIPEEYQEAIFEKFTTAEHRKKRRASVGLGLAFCKLAVEAHGGKIMVESVERQGSTFRFHIPKSAPSIVTELGV